MRSYIIICIALLAGISLKAQTENTSERLIDQLKKGTAPGLLFAKNSPAPAVNTTTTDTKESLVAQIRKGTAKGMKFLPVPATAPVTTPTTQKSAVVQPGQLASEQEIKKPEIKTAIPLPKIPMQEEVKKEEPAGKQ